MKRLFFVSLFVLAWSASVWSQNLPESTPEAQGISSSALQSLYQELDTKADGLHGLVVVRHGHVVSRGWWSPYNPAQEHMLFSLSKSFTSTAVGMLVAEGKLKVSDFVLPFFPEYAPAAPSDNLKHMRVRDLLIMGTGQHPEDIDRIQYIGGDPIEKQFLSMPVVHKPGTLFYYNTAATYMLSAIVQKVSGQSTLDYLRSRLYEPLGFKDPHWDATPQGVSLGGFGMYARTDDIAKFGQLYLQRGEWQGKRLLPASWVDEATRSQISNGSDPESDWDQGYGYQFWRCSPGFYRADGAFGQFCFVMPQYDTVVAMNSGSNDIGRLMKIVWKILIPELRPAALPENPEALASLKQTLTQLKLAPVQGAGSSPLALSLSGKHFTFDENPLGFEDLSLTVVGDVTTARLKVSGRSFEVAIQPGVWTNGPEIQLGLVKTPVSTSGAWTSPDTLTVTAAYMRLPHIGLFSCKFSADTVTIDQHLSVGIAGENKPVTVVGKLR